jgi:hypothetical protein
MARERQGDVVENTEFNRFCKPVVNDLQNSAGLDVRCKKGGYQ